MKSIVLGNGCFWCGEAVFQHVEGVAEVAPGYAGGVLPNPTYQAVTTGTTGHAEVNRVTYDPEVVSLEKLLYIFFATHDPTTPNRQGADVGTQYRSILLYTTDEDKAVIDTVLKTVQAKLSTPVVTEVAKLTTFHEAEPEHHNYYQKHPEQAYCQIVIEPKLDKLRAFLRSKAGRL
jgi:methionine-S-sulfoxide reductase